MSDVPRSKQFDDVYFSAQDGLAETRHVFLGGNNLPYAWAGKKQFTICETGFGTGLNFLAVLQLLARSDAPECLHYISFEKYPLEKAYIAECLANWAELSEELGVLLSFYPTDINVEKIKLSVFDHLVVTLFFGDVNDCMPKMDEKVDCWFLDGFKPSSNPDMWSETVFENMARLSHEGSSLATFTSAGFVRRGLKAAGFDIRKIRGFGRKREMCIGQFIGGEICE
jgi:tRNA 5-methylaminomethyl-2-thiouridine biosynthesis bifunctional protein